MPEGRNFEALKQDVRHSQLVLFLGAGVTATLTPTWGELLDKMVDRAVTDALSGSLTTKQVASVSSRILKNGTMSAYEKAGIAKHFLKERYLEVLRDVLYEKCNPASIQHLLKSDEGRVKHAFLRSTARLCDRREVMALVTYNYDDIVERAVDRAYSVYGRKQELRKPGRLPVFHVHGYLPQERALGEPEQWGVVLCREEYYQTMLSPFTWQTSVQLHFLRNYVCLFLGVSLEDMDILKMLSHAKAFVANNSVYTMMCRESILSGMGQSARRPARSAASRGGLELEKVFIQTREGLLGEVGVKLILSGDHYDSLPAKVDALTEHLSGERAERPQA
jgi:hypothetical protein